MPTDPTDPAHRADEGGRLSSPYGPQHGHVDEAAGGADSSPLEDVPSGQKAAAAETGDLPSPDAPRRM
jgi:hypothetical protein